MPKQNPTESRWAELLDINLVPAAGPLHPTVQAERRNAATREMLPRRIRAEFEEMPGLSVTLEQATRLFNVTPDIGSRILGRLIVERVLHLTANRRYVLRMRSE